MQFFTLILRSLFQKRLMPTILYLVRHGETVANKAHIMQGQTQGELNEEGLRQAEFLRDKLSNEHFDTYLSSDLKRAIDTCSIIASPAKMTVVTTPLLRERDWGDFTGCFIPDLKEREWPENVESLEKMKARASKFISFIRQNYPDKKILAVGHGIINKAIQSVYYNKPMNEIMPMKNGEIRILEL